MKKFKKTLGLMLVCSLILALVPVTSVSAAPSSYQTYYAPYNNAAMFQNISAKTFTDFYYDKDLGTITQSEGGLFGKAATDYAMKISPTAGGSRYVNLYGAIGADGIDGTTTYQMQFQLAVDANGEFGWYSYTALQPKNDVSKAANYLFRIAKENGVNKVKFMGMDTDFVWNDNTWYDVNFIVEQGANASLTVMVDGEPLKAALGTFDGVKTTSYRIPLANTDRLIKWKSMRIEVPTAASEYFYLDNMNVSVWPQGQWPEGVVKGDVYKYITHQPAEEDMNSAMWKTSAEITLTYQNPADAPAYNLLTGNGGWIRAYLNGLGDDRADVKHSLSFDFMIPEGNTLTNFWGFENSSGGSGAMNSVFGRASADTEDLTFVWHGNEIGNRLSDYITIHPDNSWHNFEVVYGMGAGINNTPSTMFYADGMPQNKPYTSIITTNNNPEVRIYNGASAWGIRNYTRTSMKNKPLIKAVSYGAATDDYLVDPSVDTITVTLTDTIAAADNNTVLLKDIEGNSVPAEVTLGDDKKTITLALGADMNTRTAYQIILTENLVCEDSVYNGQPWYQTLETPVVYDFMTGYKAFDWSEVEYVVAKREGDADAGYTWANAAAWPWGYISDNWKVGANITMNNTTGADKTITGIVAIYNPDDSLRYITQQQLTFANGGISTQQLLSDPVANTANMKVKVYLWESIDSMKPVTRGFFLWEKHAENNGPKYPGMFLHQQ